MFVEPALATNIFVESIPIFRLHKSSSGVWRLHKVMKMVEKMKDKNL